MARARAVSGAAVVTAIVVAVGTAWGAPPCEEDRARTGVGLAVGAAALVVSALDDASPAVASGMRVGDTLVQVNGTLPHGCTDWARAVRDARQERKALLLLVRRAGAEVPLALPASTWDRVVAVAPPPPIEPPSVRAVVATPAPAIAAASKMSLEEVVRSIAALTPTEPAPTRLAPYGAQLRRLHGAVAALAARGAVPEPVVAGLDTVLRYHDAAAVAWVAAEADRERTRRPAHVPVAEDTAAPFFTDSEANATIDAFPFLHEVVARDPAPGALAGEEAGLWRPLRARALLWEHARAEHDRLAAWLGITSR